MRQAIGAIYFYCCVNCKQESAKRRQLYEVIKEPWLILANKRKCTVTLSCHLFLTLCQLQTKSTRRKKLCQVIKRRERTLLVPNEVVTSIITNGGHIQTNLDLGGRVIGYVLMFQPPISGQLGCDGIRLLLKPVELML